MTRGSVSLYAKQLEERVRGVEALLRSGYPLTRADLVRG